MHRSQQKNPSKVCQQRYDDYCNKVHKDKLASMKPSVDNTPPSAQLHLEHRRKQDQQKEERLSIIEEHNHILLNNMMTIMKSPSKTIPKPSLPAIPKSLNRDMRKKQLEEINAQNTALLKRLQSAKAYYDHKDWDQFGTTQEKYLANICEYPVVKNAKPKPKTAPQRAFSLSSQQEKMPPIRRTVSGPAATKPKASVQKPKKSVEKPKRKNDSDDDSLQLSDPDLDDSDIGELAASSSNLDINKGNFSKLDIEEKGKESDAHELDDDLGSEFSDDSLDLDDHDENFAANGEGSVAKSKATKSKKTSTASSVHTGPKDDERTEYTEQDKATVESSEKHEEFEQDTEAYKPKDDDDEDEEA